MTLTSQQLYQAQLVYKFLNKQYLLEKPDFILVLGSHELAVPKFAAKYCRKNPNTPIIISGGLGKGTKTWNISEAKVFFQILKNYGVNTNRIYLEEQATNTGENILFSKRLIFQHNLTHNKGVSISKSYMTRRAYNTAAKQWAEVKWGSIAEHLSFDTYFKKADNKTLFINTMVGDLQRIKVYGKKGFQIAEEIPDKVWSAYKSLAKAGFDKYIID